MFKFERARTIAVLIAAGAISACTTARQPSEAVAQPQVTATDLAAQRQYLQTAESLSLFEAESSRLALQLSSDPGVRSLAQMLLNDSQQMSSQLLATAPASAAMLSGAMLPQHSAMLQQLSYGDPANFSDIYRNMQVMTHMQAINLHQGYLQSASNAPLQGFASNALAVAQAHLAAAQALQIAPPPPPRPARRPGRDVRRAGERG